MSSGASHRSTARVLQSSARDAFTLASRAEEDPAFCGLSTLVMTLNALNIDPRRLWKGPWRWFSEDMVRGKAACGCAMRGAVLYRCEERAVRLCPSSRRLRADTDAAHEPCSHD